MIVTYDSRVCVQWETRLSWRFRVTAFHLRAPHRREDTLWFFEKAENAEPLHRDWMADSNKTSPLEKIADFIQHCKAAASFVAQPTLDGDFSYTENRTIVRYEDINSAFLGDIVREEERDARGKKSAIVEQSTEMTLYLWHISELISREHKWTVYSFQNIDRYSSCVRIFNFI